MGARQRAMRLLVLACLCASPNAFADPEYQDIWWDASRSGMGFFVGQQENRLGIGWFHYGSDGKATYLLLSGDLINGVVQGNLERSTGPQPGPDYNAGQVSREIVGTASLTFHSDNSATLNYSYDGRSGTMDIARMTFAGATLSGNWDIGEAGTNSGCNDSAINGAWTSRGTMSFGTANGGQQTATVSMQDGRTCTTTFSLSRSGSLLTGSGNTNCSDGGGGTITFSARVIGGKYLINEYTMRNTTNGCTTVTSQVGVKQQ